MLLLAPAAASAEFLSSALDHAAGSRLSRPTFPNLSKSTTKASWDLRACGPGRRCCSLDTTCVYLRPGLLASGPDSHLHPRGGCSQDSQLFFLQLAPGPPWLCIIVHTHTWGSLGPNKEQTLWEGQWRPWDDHFSLPRLLLPGREHKFQVAIFSSMAHEGNSFCIYFLWLFCNLWYFLNCMVLLTLYSLGENYYFFRYFCRFWIKTQSWWL